MSDIDKQIELMEAEVLKTNAAQDEARQRLNDLKRAKKARDTVRAREESGIEIYHSGDYAGMECGGYQFYFGYEHTICATHGNDADCNCVDEEWAFVAWDSIKEELMRLPQSRLASKDGDVVDYLLHGIGQFVDKLPKPAKKERVRQFDITGTTGGSAGDPR